MIVDFFNFTKPKFDVASSVKYAFFHNTKTPPVQLIRVLLGSSLGTFLLNQLIYPGSVFQGDFFVPHNTCCDFSRPLGFHFLG